MAKIATRREDMTQGAREFLNDFDNLLADILEVKTESVPEAFRDNRGHETSFEFMIKRLDAAEEAKKQRDPREVSVIFNSDKTVREATEERLATITKYRQAIENEEEIEYNTPNEDKQYENELEFCCKLAKLGVFNEEDFEEEE